MKFDQVILVTLTLSFGFVFEDFIENPLAEEQTRKERARGIWTEKKTSKLCAT